MPEPASPTPNATPEAAPDDHSTGPALAAFDASLRAAVARSKLLRERAEFYDGNCLGVAAGAQVANCDEIQAAVERMAAEIQQQIDAAEEAARRAWLEPGAIREARQRAGVEDPAFQALLRRGRPAAR